MTEPGTSVPEHRESVDGRQTEDLQEVRRRAVQHRPAGLFGAAHDLDEAALEQGAEHLAAGDTTDGLDLRAHDGLAVGDDRQRFQRRLAEACVATVLLQPGHERRERRQREQLPTTRDPLRPENAAGLLVVAVEGLDRGTDGLGDALAVDAKQLRKPGFRDGPATGHQQRLDPHRQGMLGADLGFAVGLSLWHGLDLHRRRYWGVHEP